MIVSANIAYVQNKEGIVVGVEGKNDAALTFPHPKLKLFQSY